MMKSDFEPQAVVAPPSWSATTRIVILTFSLLAALWLVWLARPFWWLLILSSIIAYLLQPLIGGLTRLKIPRSIATIVVVLLALALVLSMLLILIPSLLIDLQPVSFDLAGWLSQTVTWIQALPQTWPGIQILGMQIDFTPLYNQIVAGLSYVDLLAWLPTPSEWINVLNETVRSASSVLGFATNLATSVFALTIALLVGLMLLLIFTMYLSKDLPHFFESVIALAPEPYQPEWRELWRRTGEVWHAFFRGQLLLSLVVGSSVWLGLRLIGMPGALVMGLIAGILEILPNIGPILALIPAVIVALLGGSTIYPAVPHLTVVLAVIILYTLIQQLENYILVPRILGESVGVHPIFVLAGVLVFSFHFGVLGAFVAAPILATLRTWGEYIHKRLLGEYPYPDLLPPPVPAPHPAPASPVPAPSPPVDQPSKPAQPDSAAASPAPTVKLQRPSATPPPPRPKGPAPE